MLDEQARFFQNSASLNGSESGGGSFPPLWFFAFSGPATSKTHSAGKKGERKEEL